MSRRMFEHTGAPSDREILNARARAWRNRPLLRSLYHDYFAAMAARFVRRYDNQRHPHGVVVEIGGGTGNFKSFYPDLIVTDIVPTRHIDLAADAMRLPFADGTIDNLVLQDVLHHIPFPLAFFSEANRILAPGGRIVMVEPFISTLSSVLYRISHPEPVDMRALIFHEPRDLSGTDPAAFTGHGAFDANQAIPTLLFFRYVGKFQRRFPNLVVCERTVHSMVAYPLSGGFSKPVLMPLAAVPAAKALEDILAPLAHWLAFRMLVVLEKSA
ncbi:MAG: class I SAM-dependent methyltransferase [Phycisphaerae bacterium]